MGTPEDESRKEDKDTEEKKESPESPSLTEDELRHEGNEITRILDESLSQETTSRDMRDEFELRVQEPFNIEELPSLHALLKSVSEKSRYSNLSTIQKRDLWLYLRRIEHTISTSARQTNERLSIARELCVEQIIALNRDILRIFERKSARFAQERRIDLEEMINFILGRTLRRYEWYPEGNYSAYLNGALQKQFVTEIAHSYNRPHLPLDEYLKRDDQTSLIPPILRSGRGERTPQYIVELQQVIHEMLSTFSPDQLAIIYQHFVAGITVEELASMFNVPEQTMQSQVETLTNDMITNLSHRVEPILTLSDIATDEELSDLPSRDRLVINLRQRGFTPSFISSALNVTLHRIEETERHAPVWAREIPLPSQIISDPSIWRDPARLLELKETIHDGLSGLSDDEIDLILTYLLGDFTIKQLADASQMQEWKMGATLRKLQRYIIRKRKEMSAATSPLYKTITEKELETLPDQEREVVTLLARNFPYSVIAERLNMSVNLVTFNAQNALRRLRKIL